MTIDGRDPTPSLLRRFPEGHLLPGSTLDQLADEHPMAGGIRLRKNHALAARLSITIDKVEADGTVTASMGYDYETGTGSASSTCVLQRRSEGWTIVRIVPGPVS